MNVELEVVPGSLPGCRPRQGRGLFDDGGQVESPGVVAFSDDRTTCLGLISAPRSQLQVV